MYFQKIKRGRTKKQNISSQYGQKTKTSYKRTNIEDVIVEADFLLHMNCADRLGYSIFRYTPEGMLILKEGLEYDCLLM